MEKSKEFRIVGIGASAGGLEALQEFFKNITDFSKLAFIVIQHLSPDYKSLMSELLSRFTDMKISVIDDGMVIEGGHIFLIPPRKNLSIFKNKLYLTEQDITRGLNLPIDKFFRSLADDQGKDAIGIILSGTGSDGTSGIKAIKEANGIVMVQEETSAKFDGMPASAISTGLVDYILKPEEMGDALLHYIDHPLELQIKSTKSNGGENLDTLTKIIIELKEFSGIDFSYYKEKTINRRIERRISINRISSLDEYYNYLINSKKEKQILFRELLIGVTQFFRDKEAFQSLKDKVLEKILKNPEKKTIRIWSTGCSTGEEVYSLAILLIEAAEKYNFKGEIKIFATDLDKRSIEYAGKGVYPESIIADIDTEYLKKYFFKKEKAYVVKEIIRNMIVFASHNLLKDPPFSKLDLIVCRNLFIYLKPDIQTSILANFYQSLNKKGGYLFLGNSETLGPMDKAFEFIDAKNKIYVSKSGYTPPLVPSITKSFGAVELESVTKSINRERKSGTKLQNILETVVNEFLPPSIIIDSNYLIVNVINDINPFTEIQKGVYSKELFSILPKEIALYVNNLLRQLKKDDKKDKIKRITGLESKEKNQIEIEGKRFEYDDATYFMLSFSFLKNQSEINRDKKERKQVNLEEEQNERVLELESELKTVKENLAATVEELETSNEELQSSNEELIASNEELQSTNEELQSVNEELYTVNSEHQLKIEELTQLNNDINNLLKNIEVSALYLDSQLKIRKITPELTKISHIQESDIGRPITHFSLFQNYNSFIDDINKVIESLQPLDKEIIGDDNKYYFIRIRPYRTEHNAVDGVLITIIDISEIKDLRSELNLTNERLSESLNLGQMATWQWHPQKGYKIFDNRRAEMLGYTSESFPKSFEDIKKLIHPEDVKSVTTKTDKVLKGKAKSWDAVYRMKKFDNSYIWLHESGKVEKYDEDGKPEVILGTVININKALSLEKELRKTKKIIEMLQVSKPIAAITLNSKGIITFANDEAENIFELKPSKILNRTYNDLTWNIKSFDGSPIQEKELPFNKVKKTKKQIKNYKLRIDSPEKNPIYISVDGTPILTDKNKFEGAVFIIKKEQPNE